MTRRPIASSIHRLADSEVVIAVANSLEGPAPLFTEVEGETTCVAWTDVDEARAELPQTHRLFSIGVAELLRQVPPGVGLLVDPRAPSPVHLPADRRQEVLDAARPFPAGAQIALGEPAEEPAELLQAVRDGAATVPALRRVWRAWYQVLDTDERLLVVYDVDGETGADSGAADLVVSAAQRTAYGHRLLVLALDDLPDGPRKWLLMQGPPAYER